MKASDSQQSVRFICRRRIMSGKDAQKCQVANAADSDELAHAQFCTAVSQKSSRVFPALDPEPTWELHMALHQKWYYPRVFIKPFSSSYHKHGPEGRRAAEGNSSKSTNHQQGIMGRPISIWGWLQATRLSAVGLCFCRIQSPQLLVWRSLIHFSNMLILLY